MIESFLLFFYHIVLHHFNAWMMKWNIDTWTESKWKVYEGRTKVNCTHICASRHSNEKRKTFSRTMNRDRQRKRLVELIRWVRSGWINHAFITICSSSRRMNRSQCTPLFLLSVKDKTRILSACFAHLLMKEDFHSCIQQKQQLLIWWRKLLTNDVFA